MRNILEAIRKDYIDSLEKLETAEIFDGTPTDFVYEVMQNYSIQNFRIEDTKLSGRCIHELA